MLKAELGELSMKAKAWMKTFLLNVKVLKSEGGPIQLGFTEADKYNTALAAYGILGLSQGSGAYI